MLIFAAHLPRPLAYPPSTWIQCDENQLPTFTDRQNFMLIQIVNLKRNPDWLYPDQPSRQNTPPRRSPPRATTLPLSRAAMSSNPSNSCVCAKIATRLHVVHDYRMMEYSLNSPKRAALHHSRNCLGWPLKYRLTSDSSGYKPRNIIISYKN